MSLLDLKALLTVQRSHLCFCFAPSNSMHLSATGCNGGVHLSTSGFPTFHQLSVSAALRLLWKGKENKDNFFQKCFYFSKVEFELENFGRKSCHFVSHSARLFGIGMECSTRSSRTELELSKLANAWTTLPQLKSICGLLQDFDSNHRYLEKFQNRTGAA